jgi:electron transport complex protein RnfG
MATEQPQRLWFALAVVLALAALAALVDTLMVTATRPQVAANEAARLAKVLRQVLPPGYDNHPEQDRILALAPELLGSDSPLPIYRARRGGEPVAAVITVIARQGYVGPIRLLVSVTPDGTVSGVRAVEHQETPGLGDRIDQAKSGWLRRFTGRSLNDPRPEAWAVSRDGGAFDQVAGATITSRAVVNAVRDAIVYFEQHRAEIFGQEATP